MNDKEVINKIINDVLADWLPEFVRIRKAQAKAKLGTASGAGQNSFDHSMIKATGSQIARALLLFITYLRFADLKNKHWDAMPPIDKMEQYVRDRGVEKFRRKFTAKYKSIPSDTDKLINKIAWGIAIKIKQRGHLKKKRVPWYRKSANKGMGVLYGRLSEALSKETLDKLAIELSKNNLAL